MRWEKRWANPSLQIAAIMSTLIHDLLPPLARRWHRQRAAGVCRWSGNFSSWAEAAEQCPGYDQQNILEQVKNAALRVRAGDGAFERDAVVFSRPEYSWPLLSVLLHAAGRKEGRLRVLDFGGSLGSTYSQHRRWLEGLPEVRWGVVEQPHFVRCGRLHFETENLRFYSSIAECLAEGQPDVALLSSVLGYLPEPRRVLDEISASGISCLLIDRTGFTHNDRERITIQKVPSVIYSASYPCRFFSRTELARYLAPFYEEVASFPALDQPPSFADFLGLVFERRAET